MEPQPIHAAPVQAETEGGSQEGGVMMAPPAFDLGAGGDPPPGSKQPRRPVPPSPPQTGQGTQQTTGPQHGQGQAQPRQLNQHQRELTGQFDPERHSDFVLADINEGQNNRRNLLRREASVAFHQMVQAARADGHTIVMLSATRNYDYQANQIWDPKWTGRRRGDGNRDFSQTANHNDRATAIMTESSMPGTSRHHWGTDFDINSTTANDWNTRADLIALYAWMQANAARFGFGQTYDAQTTDNPPGTRVGGYNQEKWHWSYIPLAAGFQADYVAQISDQDIANMGFQGASTATSIHPVTNYVNNVATTTRSAAGFGRPSIRGRVNVTVTPLRVYEDTSTRSSAIYTVASPTSFNYYDTHTDARGNVWVLIEEGWLIQQGATPSRRGASAPAPNATLTPTPQAPTDRSPTTPDPRARPADPRPRVSPPPPRT